jgi:hypothetical protein
MLLEDLTFALFMACNTLRQLLGKREVRFSFQSHATQVATRLLAQFVHSLPVVS